MTADTELILKKLDEINVRLEKMDRRIDLLENRMDKLILENKDEHARIFQALEENKKDHERIFRELEENKKDHNRIFKALEENKEEHEKIFEELHSINMTVTRMETEYQEKIAILFDAYESNKQRQVSLSAEVRRIGLKTDENSFKILNLEKVLNQ